MAIRITREEFPLLRDAIERISGIRVGDGKAYLIESRLGRLLEEYQCTTFSEFDLKLRNKADADLRSKVINAMSTQETLWFRDMHPYRILKEVLLPQYADEAKRGLRRNLSIWSAACSTGQEPYSLAMVILESLPRYPALRAQMFSILATDIATTAVNAAQNGLYDRIAMGRGLPAEYRSRFFSDEGRHTRISPEVQRLVNFRQFNLQDSFASLGRFDLVLCRNVAIYFSDEFKRDLFARIKRVLNPGEHLFLGSSESISAYSSEYDLMEYDGGIYYRAKDGASPAARAA